MTSRKSLRYMLILATVLLLGSARGETAWAFFQNEENLLRDIQIAVSTNRRPEVDVTDLVSAHFPVGLDDRRAYKILNQSFNLSGVSINSAQGDKLHEITYWSAKREVLRSLRFSSHEISIIMTVEDGVVRQAEGKVKR